ncbi:MAG: cyclic nucleotide-binding/CBS domain-containing protein [Acidimicrobiia bacterium]
MRPRPTDPIRSLDWAELISVDERLPLRAVASVLQRHHVGAALVAQRTSEIGIVTERDLVAAIASGADLDEVQAGMIASQRLVTVDPADRIVDVARRLIDEEVRHVAVVDRDMVVGVLSIRDLLVALVDDYPDDPAG